MENIAGYRTLNQEEIDLINGGKEIGSHIEEYVKYLEQRTDIDKRWLAIGKTSLQQGMMAITRSIARPEGF